jgi:GntR family transcriptional regulator
VESAVEHPSTQLPADILADIDRASPIPLYFQIATALENAIADGRLPAGSRLENEIALGQRLSLSRPTIRRALQELVNKGLLVRRRGIGTQVVQGPVTRKVELTSLYDDLEGSDKRPSTALLLRQVVEADEHIAGTLSVAVGSPILHIRRVRLSGGVPLAVLENHLPAQFADITSDELASHGLYQLMRDRGTFIRVAHQRIGARSATTEESRLLEITGHGAVLTMDRTAYDSGGRAVEYGHHCYRPDLYAFEITLVDS